MKIMCVASGEEHTAATRSGERLWGHLQTQIFRRRQLEYAEQADDDTSRFTRSGTRWFFWGASGGVSQWLGRRFLAGGLSLI